LRKFLAQEIGTTEENILTFDLCFAEWNEGSIFGLQDEFISSARMDNLYSVFCSIKALTGAN
jgi:aspartyl aminopeptidase